MIITKRRRSNDNWKSSFYFYKPLLYRFSIIVLESHIFVCPAIYLCYQSFVISILYDTILCAIAFGVVARSKPTPPLGFYLKLKLRSEPVHFRKPAAAESVGRRMHVHALIHPNGIHSSKYHSTA